MKIERKFEELKREEEGAYMPHIYYGDPSSEFSLKLVEILIENGADFLEFGIPFSDPTADGPVFQESCERALNNGITPEKCLEGIEEIRSIGHSIPIILTTYFNIPYKYGIQDFFDRLSKLDVQGIIVPNMPLEEVGVFEKKADEAEIDIIFQVTPNTNEKRLKSILKKSSGFLYVINFEGVTGIRESIGQSTLTLIKRIRENSDIPLLAGFGISEPSQAEKLISEGADGVITGSAIAKLYRKEAGAPEAGLNKVKKFALKIKKGCIEGYRR